MGGYKMFQFLIGIINPEKFTEITTEIGFQFLIGIINPVKV